MGENYKNKKTFIRVYDEYADAIFRYCALRISDRERAKEIMQETFTNVWQYANIKGGIENMRAFLYKSARNLCINEIASRRTFSLDEMVEKSGFDVIDPYLPSPETASETALLLRKIRELSSEEAELLSMRYTDDMEVKEIAKILDMLPNTVTVKIQRAEEKLKKLYQDGKRN